MKYVILKASSSKMGVDYAFPFIFSSRIVHSLAAEGFKAILREHYDETVFDFIEVLSAGTVAVCDDVFVCSPGSETLAIANEWASSENGMRDSRIMYLYESTGGVLL